MARKLKSDKLLFTATLVLVCASLVMVYSSSAVIGLEQYGQRPTYFLWKQATFALLGLALMPVLMRVDYHHYRQPAVIWTALAMTGVALVGCLLFGPKINGARRWFGIAGIVRSDPKVGEAFTLLTCAPGPDIAPYHDRQVVLLSPAECFGWLDAASVAADFVRPLAAGSLTVARA